MYQRSLPLSLFTGALLLVSTPLLWGADPPAPAASQTAARDELLRLERDWTTAENKHDEATLRRILDEKFVATFGTKTPPYDKEGFIKAQLAGDVDPTVSDTLSDQIVIVDGDTAVVVGTDTERSTKKGEARTAVARYTATYVRRNGRWLALAEHMALVPQAK
jgi:ketosteroid isomerase-like protein